MSADDFKMAIEVPEGIEAFDSFDFDSIDDPNGTITNAPKLENITQSEITHHDVLCGRGVATNRHPGNESFRSLVSVNKVREEVVGMNFML
jgi:hypothetical protein